MDQFCTYFPVFPFVFLRASNFLAIHPVMLGQLVLMTLYVCLQGNILWHSEDYKVKVALTEVKADFAYIKQKVTSFSAYTYTVDSALSGHIRENSFGPLKRLDQLNKHPPQVFYVGWIVVLYRVYTEKNESRDGCIVRRKLFL